MDSYSIVIAISSRKHGVKPIEARGQTYAKGSFIKPKLNFVYLFYKSHLFFIFLSIDDIIDMGYHFLMIRTFNCKDTEKLFKGSFIKKLPTNIQRVALRKLKILDAATQLDTLKVPPGNRLEALKGDREGRYSIRIND